jgi:ABC-2 type transport system permease protein
VNSTRFRELFRAQVLAFTRDRTALFFTFLFPLMFLLVFGLLFRDGGTTSRPTVLVAGHGPVVDNLPSAALAVKRVDDVAAGLARVRNGDEPALIEERGDEVTLRFAASDRVQSATIRGILLAEINAANLRVAGVTPRITLSAQQVEDESLSAIEFLTPGLLGWAVSVAAVFGAALTLVTWRTRHVLRRLRLSPMRLSELAGSRVMLSVLISVAEVLLYIGVAVLLFDMSPTGSWWMCFPIAAAGTLAFLAIGLLIGAFAKTVEAASAVANLVTLPMAFLSGAFFPLDGAPGWVEAIANALPMKPMIDAMTDTMVRGKGPASALPQIGILLAFALVVGFVATRRRIFRWDAV